MLARNTILALLLFKCGTFMFGCYRYCREVQLSQSNEDALLLTNNLADTRHSMENSHNHAIPNVLIFTHYTNLLEYKVNTKTTDDDLATQKELLVLQRNVRNVIALHPGATVRFLTDQDCLESIHNVLGPETKLVDYFVKESRGMYKSDMCRGAALWETGGLYFDVDLGVRMPVWKVLGTHATFVTPKVHAKSKQRPGFFQAFIGATQHHPILKRYLELFVQYYDGKIKLETPLLKEEKQMLGVRILYLAYSQILEESAEPQKQQAPPLEETTKAITTTSQESLLSNSPTQVGPIELWQEVYYSHDKFPTIPEPTWGTEKSCKYVVLANQGWPPAVPFYSRVAGSRMCPATTRDGET